MSERDNGMRSPSTIIVVGTSGAGRQTTLNALEDCGFHRVDNLPADLIPHLIQNNPSSRPLALGLGSLKTDHDYQILADIMAEIGDELQLTLLYLDADDETIARRYNETRRVHPNSDGRDIFAAIQFERALLEDIRELADVIIDTSRLSPHDLRAEIKRRFNLADAQQFQIMVESFSYKFGAPPNADMIFDCRFLKNPHWEPELREKTGQNQEVQDFVKIDGNFEKFHRDITNMLGYMLPILQSEGRSYFTLGFGCTGGKHRSVTLAETFTKELRDKGYQVILTHRELEKTKKE